jgi:hypothetical protein
MNVTGGLKEPVWRLVTGDRSMLESSLSQQ